MRVSNKNLETHKTQRLVLPGEEEPGFEGEPGGVSKTLS